MCAKFDCRKFGYGQSEEQMGMKDNTGLETKAHF
jgi:hypothetical protein